MKTIKKIFVANRGEIAVRIIKTAKEMGISTVVAFADDDKNSLFVEQADTAIPYNSLNLPETYLSAQNTIRIAKSTKCDAIHPGYGFLSENPEFAKECEMAGLIFIGPHPEAIRLMGNKIESREFVKNLAIPLIKSYSGTIEELKKISQNLDYPILIKAASGGGGKGMRIVNKPGDFNEALETTSREAKNYFGDETVYIEKYLEDPRHIEVQILGDTHGNIIHLFERECSLQRRHQKIIEEAPSPTLNEELREKITSDAIKIAQAINYNNAGTIEFIFDKNLNYYFLEMNTRLQVEHPVTEFITGIDIVEKQIKIARGETLNIKQNELKINGFAIEARVYAESPENNFLPSPGKLTLYNEPEIANLRIDSGIKQNDHITGNYDPMISKVIAWEESRTNATLLLKEGLKSYGISGPETNLAYLNKLLSQPDFIENNINTTYCSKTLNEFTNQLQQDKSGYNLVPFSIAFFIHSINIDKRINNIWNQIGFWRLNPDIPIKIEDSEFRISNLKINNNTYSLSINNTVFQVDVLSINSNKIELTIDETYFSFQIGVINEAVSLLFTDGFTYKAERLDILNNEKTYSKPNIAIGVNSNAIKSTMHGKIIKINAIIGNSVKEGDTLVILESMKMENSILSPKNGIVKSINIEIGEQVEPDKLLVELEDETKK